MLQWVRSWINMSQFASRFLFSVYINIHHIQYTCIQAYIYVCMYVLPTQVDERNRLKHLLREVWKTGATRASLHQFMQGWFLFLSMCTWRKEHSDVSAGVHRGKRPLGWVLLELKLLDVALWESKSGCPQEQDLLDQLYRFYKQVHFFFT